MSREPEKKTYNLRFTDATKLNAVSAVIKGAVGVNFIQNFTQTFIQPPEPNSSLCLYIFLFM